MFAVPSAHVREMVGAVAPHVPASADLLSVVKGMERGTHARMTDVIAQAGGFSPRRIAALSGPNLALEIARKLPASAVVAAEDVDLAARIQERLGRRRFRLYVNRDVLGVELCGALKNVVAIAAGAAEELGFGDNGKAGLMTRGVAEMTRLGIAAGANPLTFAGLAGIGDVIATCGSSLSRNHRLGVELARGRKWADIEATLPGRRRGRVHGRCRPRAGRRAGRRDADRPRGPPRAVRGQERQALPDRPAGPRVEGRARRLRPLGGPGRCRPGGRVGLR